MARILLDVGHRSAMLMLNDGNSIPLYWTEPHQFLGGLSISLFNLFRNERVSLEGFLKALAPLDETARWLTALRESGLLAHVNRTLREFGVGESLQSTPGGSHQEKYCTLLYALCRAMRPETVVETGVGAGASSAFILQALSDNGRGELFSIERVRERRTGILVSSENSARWHLMIGKSSDLLPRLVDDLEMDIFIHDSEHTNKNMLFEYRTAWPRIKQSGYLLSDDVVNNFSFYRFIRTVRLSQVAVVEGYGIVRKDSRHHQTPPGEAVPLP